MWNASGQYSQHRDSFQLNFLGPYFQPRNAHQSYFKTAYNLSVTSLSPFTVLFSSFESKWAQLLVRQEANNDKIKPSQSCSNIFIINNYTENVSQLHLNCTLIASKLHLIVNQLHLGCILLAYQLHLNCI